MTRGWRSLRVRLAVLGFLASYVPALLLFGVVLVTETETTVGVDDEAVTTTSTNRSPWAMWTLVALAPTAAAVAWWWAGRAVRPLAAAYDRLADAADTQRRLIEETSHELRIPLSVLANNAEVLLAHPNPTLEVYRDGLARSGRAAERMRATIDDLLVDARGRARTIDRRPADLMAIARGVVEDARVQAESKRMTLSVTGPANAVCPVDEPTVRRAVANLVDNAIRYAPAATAVEIVVEPAAVVVTDHGPGIPAEHRDHVFERFWRGSDDTNGTGLGLPIAHQIAVAHGGTLTITSPGPTGDGCVCRLDLGRR